MGISEKFKHVGSMSSPEPCYIAFSPSKPESEALILALDKGVISLKQQKRLAAIADKYALPKSSYQW